jgi:hypothetical protein
MYPQIVNGSYVRMNWSPTVGTVVVDAYPEPFRHHLIKSVTVLTPYGHFRCTIKGEGFYTVTDSEVGNRYNVTSVTRLK